MAKETNYTKQWDKERWLKVSSIIAQYFKNSDMAIFLGELVDRHDFFKKENKLLDGKWFYAKDKYIMDKWAWGRKRVQVCREKLIQEKIIRTKFMSVPRKLYYNLNMDNLDYLLNEFLNNPEFKKGRMQELENTPARQNKIVSVDYARAQKNKSCSIVLTEQHIRGLTEQHIYNNKNKDNQTNVFNKLKTNKTDLKKSVSQDKEISLIGNRKYKRVKRPNPNINKKQTPNKKPRTQIDRFIELSVLKIWNDCPTTSSHRLGTKVHKSISLCIKQLMQGTFYKSKSLDKDWLETLPDDYSTKEFTKKEIKETIQNLTNYSKDGFWPKEKKHYKNLLTLLYNERTGKSIFLKTFAKPPEPLKDTKQLQWPTIPEEQWVAEELKRPIFKDSERKFRDYNNKFIAFCKDFNRYYQYCLGKGTFNGTFITVRYLAKKYVQDLGFMQYDNPGSCLDIRSMYFKAFNALIMDNVHGGNVPADLPRFK